MRLRNTHLMLRTFQAKLIQAHLQLLPQLGKELIMLDMVHLGGYLSEGMQ